MDIHLYLQQQIEQTHPPFPPSPLPVFSIPFPPPTPPWAQGQPCPPGSLYGSGPPTKTPGGGLGRGLAEVGWGVFLFTFCCPRSLGWGAGEAGTGAVRGREAHSPRAPASPTSLPLPQLPPLVFPTWNPRNLIPKAPCGARNAGIWIPAWAQDGASVFRFVASFMA